MIVQQTSSYRTKGYMRLMDDEYIGPIFRNDPSYINEWATENLATNAQVIKCLKAILLILRYLVRHVARPKLPTDGFKA
jgi:hypothetical protein